MGSGRFELGALSNSAEGAHWGVFEFRAKDSRTSTGFPGG